MLESGKLTRLKSDLREGGSERLMTFLGNEASEEDLITIREQKLLLIPPDLQMQAIAAQGYVLAARRLLNGASAVRARNYAEFTILCAETFRAISKVIARQIVQLKRLGKREVLAVAEEVLVDCERGMNHGRSAALDSHAKGQPGEQSEISEYLLHEFNGLNNDIHWAAFRAINEVMKVVPDSTRERLTRREWEDAKKEFLDLAFRALAWNGWQYMLDKVTYGEWNVGDISASEVREIKFEIADVKLERAKIVGIRRRLSDTMRRMAVGAKEVKPLEDFGVHCAIQFVAHYLKRPVTTLDLVELDKDFRKQFKTLLTFFGRGDDLLLGASSGDFAIIGEYFAAILLRAWVLGRRKAASLSQKRLRQRIRESGLPLSLCKQLAEAHGWPVADFENILEFHITTLPTENYYDLVRHPFLRCGTNIDVIGGAAFDDWPAPIRSRLMRGGATADRYGRLWEDYCARLLADFGWLIVGRNVKIRSKGKTVTDVDVLALKLGLLLVIQFKAMGIGAATVYDHWLARSKILRGAEQARLAIDELGPKSELLRGLLSSKRVTEWPARVQPLIITTSDIFTGWNPKDVPVASVGSIVSILNGASVKHTTSTGVIVSTEKFIRGDEADADEFLGLLDTPLDWRIAEEAEQVESRLVKTEFGTFWLPELVRRIRPRPKVEFCGAAVEA